jgi:hypothetical protein
LERRSEVFKDFALYGNNSQGVMVDPATGPYTRAGAGSNSGGVGGAWVRQYVTFVPDRDTVFLGTAIRVMSPAQAVAPNEHLNAQHFAKFQLERSKLVSGGTPSTFTNAREVQVVIKPDRMNYVLNPSLETNANNWAVGTNCTIARSTAKASVGSASLAMTSVAAGNMSARTSTPLATVPVVPGQYVTASARFLAATTPRSCRVLVQYLDAVAGFVSPSPAGTTVTNNTSTWVTSTSTSVAPAGAVSANIYVLVDATGAAGEVH